LPLLSTATALPRSSLYDPKRRAHRYVPPPALGHAGVLATTVALFADTLPLPSNAAMLYEYVVDAASPASSRAVVFAVAIGVVPLLR
jgi:hypothetical protein